MDILSVVEEIRNQAKQCGNYRQVSHDSGVGYQWLSKFAVGTIENPTVQNVAKLQKYFSY